MSKTQAVSTFLMSLGREDQTCGYLTRPHAVGSYASERTIVAMIKISYSGTMIKVIGFTIT